MLDIKLSVEFSGDAPTTPHAKCELLFALCLELEKGVCLEYNLSQHNVSLTYSTLAMAAADCSPKPWKSRLIMIWFALFGRDKMKSLRKKHYG